MDLKTILKKVPRVIEKMIMDDVMYSHYLKEHKIKFKKTLAGIKMLFIWLRPSNYDLFDIFKIIRMFSL